MHRLAIVGVGGADDTEVLRLLEIGRVAQGSDAGIVARIQGTQDTSVDGDRNGLCRPSPYVIYGQ